MSATLRRKAPSQVLGLAVSVGIHLTLIAALLTSRPSARSPIGGGGAFYPVSVVDMSGFAASAPVAVESPDPLAAIVERDERSSAAASLAQDAAGQSGASFRSGGAGLSASELDRLFKPAKASAARAAAEADPGDDLAAQIARCFTRAGSGIEVTVVLGLDEQGRLSRSPTILRPPLATIPPERLEVEASAFQAVQTCGPYVGQGNAAHTARVTLR